jgi:hypothetical protein
MAHTPRTRRCAGIDPGGGRVRHPSRTADAHTRRREVGDTGTTEDAASPEGHRIEGHVGLLRALARFACATARASSGRSHRWSTLVPSGGESGIRTRGPVIGDSCFQDKRVKPLRQLSAAVTFVKARFRVLGPWTQGDRVLKPIGTVVRSAVELGPRPCLPRISVAALSGTVRAFTVSPPWHVGQLRLTRVSRYAFQGPAPLAAQSAVISDARSRTPFGRDAARDAGALQRAVATAAGRVDWPGREDWL